MTAGPSGGSLLPAHGAVVSGIVTGAIVSDFDAAFSRPTLDNAAGEPEPVNAVAAFPTRLAGVTTASDTQGLVGPDGIAQRQQLVLMPGQFLAGTTAGNGTQTLFDRMSGDVYYSDSTDWVAPRVGDVVLTRAPGETTALVSVEASDASNIHRVVALYQAGGDWQTVDLGANGGIFAGALTVPASIANEQIRVVVQVVDGAGNVSWASNKGPGFAPTPPPPPAPQLTLVPSVPASGWFAQSPEITITGNASATFALSIDGGPKVPYLAPFTPIGLADGAHVIEALGSDGSSAFVTIRVDTTPPVVDVTLSPAANDAGWHNAPVTATFGCTDSASGVLTCSPPTSTGAQEGTDVPVNGAATDLVGLTTTVARTIKVDQTPPTAPIVALDPPAPTVDQPVSLTATTSDGLSGVIGGEWWIGADPGVGNATPLDLSAASLSALLPAIPAPGPYTVSTRSIDAAGNWSGTGTATFTVVAAVNSVPVAVGQVVETLEDTSVGVVLSGTDADVSDVLSFAVVSAPLHGSLSGTVPALVYTPDVDFHGSDSFSFTVDDGVDVSVPGLVAITVTSVNDAPTVVTPVVLAGVEGSVVPIVATVGDVDGDVVSVVWSVTAGVGVDAGAGCSIGDVASTGIVCSDDGVFTVTATVSDGVATAVAQTELTVANADPSVVLTGVPLGPVVQGAVVQLTAAVSDPGVNDTSTCTVDWGDGAIGSGTVTAGGAGTGSCAADHVYDAIGEQTVVVTVGDDDGATASVSTVVTVVAPDPGNRPPTAIADSLSTPEDVALPITLTGSDPDGDVLTFTIVDQPANGVLTGTGAELSYVPDVNFHGDDVFTFIASDGTATSSTRRPCPSPSRRSTMRRSPRRPR